MRNLKILNDLKDLKNLSQKPIGESKITNMLKALQETQFFINSGNYNSKTFRDIAVRNKANILFLTYAVRHNIFTRIAYGKYCCNVKLIEPIHAKGVLQMINNITNDSHKKMYLKKQAKVQVIHDPIIHGQYIEPITQKELKKALINIDQNLPPKKTTGTKIFSLFWGLIKINF